MLAYVESGRTKLQCNGAGIPGYRLGHTQNTGLPGKISVYRHNRSPIFALAPEIRNALRTARPSSNMTLRSGARRGR